MTFRMDGSGGMEVSKDASKEPAAAEASKSKADEGIDDAQKFVRERNMLLLSALYKLYGEEWSGSPDWSKVTEEIKRANIPNFGEGFTPESCELQYKTLIDKGYQVGIANLFHTVRTPRRLKEADKRLYILAETSNDLVATSKIIDDKMRVLYKKELAQIDGLGGGNSDKNKDIDLKELEENIDVDTDEELEDIMAYEDPSAQELATEVPMLELNENIVGYKDVLVLAKYCNDAVDFAVKKYAALNESLHKLPPSPTKLSPLKKEKVLELNKSTVPANKVSEELNDLVHSAIANTSEEDRPKVTSPQLPVTHPGMPLPDIPSTKQPDSATASPEKSAPKCENSDDDKSVPDVVKEESASAAESLPKDNGEQTTAVSSSSPIKSTTVLDTNGKDPEIDVAVAEESPVTTEVLKEKPDDVLIDDTLSNNNITAPEKDTEPVTETSTPNNDAPISITSNANEQDGIPTDDSEATTASESSEVNEVSQQDATSKGKSVRKPATAIRPIPTRTSSRLNSPEPTEKLNENEKSPKKPPSRQSSTSDGHTPTLRSRVRGGTPTKVSSENEPAKSSSSINTSKLDFTEENEDETFETPRSTPDSTDMKSDTDNIHEAKPPQQLKVYSAKPPASISHVDAKFLDAFMYDEDDPELTEIDSSVNKSSNDKSASKTYSSSRRGQAGTSEVGSESGNNEDSTQNKRAGKKSGISDDVDDETIMNNDEAASKRLTRSSLKIHDAANEESRDAPQTESEKAASESSFSEKEKKPRVPKSMLRLKTLQDENLRVYGDVEESPEGTRLTRARAAKTSTPQQSEKRNKPPSVGDSEGLSESEPTSTRATRSRASTASNMPVLEATTVQPPATPSDDPQQKAFRKSALVTLDKVITSDAATQLQKYLEDPYNIVLKGAVDFESIKEKVELGKTRTPMALFNDLISLTTNVLMAHPNSKPAKENALSFFKYMKSLQDEFKNQFNPPPQKNENSDVESSTESHDEPRGDSSTKQISGGGRRKRKRSVSETSEEPQDNKRRVTRTSTSTPQQSIRKTKHPISPDIISANRMRH